MSYSRPTAQLRHESIPQKNRPWAPGQTTRPRLNTPPPQRVRRYEICWLDEMGLVQERTEIAPAQPQFERTASAFTHGTLIQTDRGEVPVEDLFPGINLMGPDGQTSPLIWKGSITLMPGGGSDLLAHSSQLYRVVSDAFGPGRPMRDVILGPAARRLIRGARAQRHCASMAALAPMSVLADGHQVVALQPLRPTRVFHLQSEQHMVLLADGMEVESYHPGAETMRYFDGESSAVFTSLFPSLDPGRGFGKMCWPQMPDGFSE